MKPIQPPVLERGRRSKLASVEEAAALISDGSSIALGGIHAHNGPMPIVRELVRQGRHDLTLIPNVSVGLPAELLIAAGAVKRIYASYVGLEHQGLAPAFRKAGQEGTIEIHDVDEPFPVYAMRAGAATLPFMPFPFGHEAIDVVRLNPDDYRTVTDPFTGRDVVVVRPLNPDFGLIHVPQADPFGNVVIDGSIVQDILIAKSSSHVIVTAEEIVPVSVTQRDPKATTIVGFFVDTVIHAPHGAHPTSCHGRYTSDDDHIELYKQLGPDKYLEQWIHSTTEAQYIERAAPALITSLEGAQNHAG